MRALVLCVLAAAVCGCAKVEELWSKIDPLSGPEPPRAAAEENPRTPPPSMPSASEARSKTSPHGDRSGQDRIMSLGLEGPVPPPQDDRRQLWDPDPLRKPLPKPAEPRTKTGRAKRPAANRG